MIRVTGDNRQMIPLYSCFLLLFTLQGLGLVQAQNSKAHVVIDAYPNTATVEQGTTLVLVCRVVGVPSATVLSYQWTCPGGSCDAGAVDPEWAAKVQQGNILVVNVRNENDAGSYTCTVQDSTPKELGRASTSVAVAYGLSLMNEDGGLRVFFPNNSFVTNTTLTHTNSPRGVQEAARGNDHIVCYGEGQFTTRVIWHNSGGVLEKCAQPCPDCHDRCVRNGGVGADPPLLRHTHIHMYTNSTAYVNQDLECRTFGVASSSIFIGMYLKDGVNTALQPPSSIMQRAITSTTVSVSWSPVSGATGYYVSYQRQDLGTPPVVTPQYERILGGASTSVTLSGLEPGTTYRVRVWSTNGRSVSSEAEEVDVTTVESAPSPPRMLAVTGTPSGSTVELNWLPPLHPNGAIRYEIEYEPAMTLGDTVIAGHSSSLYFTLTLPNDLPSYAVRVRAVNSRGSATSGHLVVNPALSTVSRHTTTTTTTTTPEPSPAPTTAVPVVATGHDTVEPTVSATCDVFPLYYIIKYRLRTSTGDHTTVNISGASVTLVDLVPNAEYDVEVAAISSNGAISNSSLAAHFTVVPTTAVPPTCGCFSTGVGAAVGGFIGGVLLTAAIAGVVAVAVFCRVKRELTAMSSKSDPAVYDDPHELQTNPAYGVLSNTKAMKGEDTD